MTEKRDISRRNALKGIAGTGALLGGVGLGLSGSAGAVNVPDQHPKEQIADVSFHGCKAVEIVFREDTYFPVEGLQFRFYSKGVGKVTMSPTIRYDETSEVDDKHGSNRRRFVFYGGIDRKHDRVLSVSAGKKTYENPNSCKKRRHDRIDLEGVCYKKKKNRAKFLVSNENKKAVEVTWKAKDGKQSDTLTVPKKGTAEFWAPLHSGKKTRVALYYDGEKVAVAKANTDDHC